MEELLSESVAANLGLLSRKSSADGHDKSAIPTEQGDNPPTVTNILREELHQLSPQIGA